MAANFPKCSRFCGLIVDVNFVFLGVGDASQSGLGHASAVVELGENRMMIDCGPGTLDRFMERYASLPQALFITHCHLDHIADLEKLFIKCWFSAENLRPLLFVPVSIIELLQERVGTYPGALAEGGVNFWQAFQLIPVSSSFEFGGQQFDVWPARHHGVNSAFSLSLPDTFYYTGDTRPVPEILEHKISPKALIFHDCSVVGNPSHTGLDDILREYSESVRQRIHVYHYNNASQRETFEAAGFRCIEPGERFQFV